MAEKTPENAPGMIDLALLEKAQKAADACIALDPMKNHIQDPREVEAVIHRVQECRVADEAEKAHEAFHHGLPPKLKQVSDQTEVAPDLRARLTLGMQR